MDRVIKKKGFSWVTILLIVLGVGGVATLVGFIWRDAGVSKLNVQTERLLIDTVHQGVFQEYIPISGVVQPIKTVFLDALEGGRVEEKFVEDGSMVTKGQPILRLSNADLERQYLTMEADINQQLNQIQSNALLAEQQSISLQEQALDVQFRLDLLSKRTQRNSELYDDGAVSRVEYEETQDEYEHLQRREIMLRKTIKRDSARQVLQQGQMENSLDLSKRNLDFAKRSLENLVIKSPIDGQLSGLEKEIGELISSGENVGQIDNLTTFKVRARIDEYYISRVFVDQSGSVTLAGIDYPMRIKKIYPQVTGGNFEVDMIFVEDTPPSLKRGQNLSIKLELSGEETATLLARGSFYQKTGGNWVYLIDPATGNARKQPIKVNKQNPNFYEITEGLKPGDVVVVSSYENFGDKDELVLR